MNINVKVILDGAVLAEIYNVPSVLIGGQRNLLINGASYPIKKSYVSFDSVKDHFNIGIKEFIAWSVYEVDQPE